MRKRIICFLLCCAAIFGLSACATQPYEDYKTFDNVEDYCSDAQGYMGWDYFSGDVAWYVERLAYVPYYGCYRNKYVQVQGSQWRPHREAEVVLRHTAQRSGNATVDISLKIIELQLKDVPNHYDDDGVTFKVYDNAKNIIYEQELTGTEETSEAEKTLSVKLKKGDELWFSLSANERELHDLTDVHITIRF